MGCDIHFHVEIQSENGVWLSADKWEYKDDYINVVYSDQFYNGRNYGLFSILAGVRNGTGFAGCDTGDGFEPIDSPRGLPDNLSFEVKVRADQWGHDGHSHSHLTLKEIKDFDFKSKKTKRRGFVYLDTYLQMEKQKNKTPDFYFGDTNMTKVKCNDIKGFSKDEIVKRYGNNVCVQLEWDISYYDVAKCFIDNTLPKMSELNSDPNKVRAVFWFDN